MNTSFREIWPGDRLWVMFDICSEQTEISDLPNQEKERYSVQSDAIAHWACDIGLPCISILKSIKRFELIANSAMAPFAPVEMKTLPEAQEIFDRCILKPGASCGWYCSSKQIENFQNDPISILLKRKKYRYIVYGPETTGLIINLTQSLLSIGTEVWIISDGIRKYNFSSLSNKTSKVSYSTFRRAYDHWRKYL